MRSLRLFVAAFFMAPIGCMTLVKDPGAARVAHPVTLGVPGVLYNPSKSVGLLVNADLPTNSTDHVVSGGRGASAFTVTNSEIDDDQRAITRQDASIRASFLHFPSNNSFFFWGLTSRYGEARAGYAEHTAGFQLDEPKTANVEWTDRYDAAGATLGTSMISTSDAHFFTSVFGVSAEKQLSSSRTFANDGVRHDVDTTQRDATLAAYDDVRKSFQFKYYFMTGLSF